MTKLLAMGLFYSITMFFSSLFGKAKTETQPTMKDNNHASFYTIEMKGIDGKTVSMSQYKGKKVMIVNVASECGFTPQYKELEELYKKHNGKLEILGFPADDFGHQEPGSNDEIQTFCSKNYGVTFTMFAKTHVIGEEKNPLYQWLTKKELNGWNETEPKWNFSKYLINENGELIKVFPSSVSPLSKEVTDLL